MSHTFEIKRVVFEKQLQNLNIEQLDKTLTHTNLSFAIDLLSVDKNMKLLTKKADIIFLSKLFKKMNSLCTKQPYRQFLKTSNDYFKQSLPLNLYFKTSLIPNIDTLFTNTPYSQFQNFIEHVVDLSISQKKKHTFKELEALIDIAKNYQINEKKLVTWIGKISSNTNSVSFFNDVVKLTILQKPLLKERFISIVINMTNNISLLDKLFSTYESEIYNIYTNYKYEKRTWNCLLPKIYFYGGHLPYIDSDKLNWLENKKIGYKNNPVYFELYFLEKLFKEAKYHSPSELDFNLKIQEDYYKNLIYDSLLAYKQEYLPKKAELTHNNNTVRDSFSAWRKESPLREILSVYDQNPDFYNFCQKLTFKLHLEEKLVSHDIKDKKLKI